MENHTVLNNKHWLKPFLETLKVSIPPQAQCILAMLPRQTLQLRWQLRNIQLTWSSWRHFSSLASDEQFAAKSSHPQFPQDFRHVNNIHVGYASHAPFFDSCKHEASLSSQIPPVKWKRKTCLVIDDWSNPHPSSSPSSHSDSRYLFALMLLIYWMKEKRRGHYV